jgi:hypothetical protein
MAQDHAACVAAYREVGLPLVAPAQRAEALATFERYAADPSFRAAFAARAMQSAARLYASGAWD